MTQRLSTAEIDHRLVRLRNLERLHSEQKQRLEKVEAENKLLKRENSELRQLLENALIRIAELEEKIFGKKRNDRSDSGQSSSPSSGGNQTKKLRRPVSYQRSIPTAPPTETKHFPVTVCKHCGGRLTQLEEIVRYIEDIVLPQLMGQITKTITKLIIERGYCPKCGVWTAARDLRGAVVTLGQNIKLLVCYLVTILDCSYEQVKTLTTDLYNLTLSDGEITAILQEQSIKWLPEYERLKEAVRASPGVHVDETTWPIQIFTKHTYAWMMSASNSLARAYKLANSRGKGHAVELLGEDYQGVRITDCFPGYKNMSGLHQICWAHLHRKIRDLLENKNLPEEKRPPVKTWYEQFSVAYGQLRCYLAEPLVPVRREQQTTQLREKIHLLRQPDRRDPKKLADLKNLLIEYDHALFTCLRFNGIPCDNNRAERDLRLLVIKRKKSFGSRTEAGARAMEILLSVCWSTWHMKRGNFLPALARLWR